MFCLVLYVSEFKKTNSRFYIQFHYTKCIFFTDTTSNVCAFLLIHAAACIVHFILSVLLKGKFHDKGDNMFIHKCTEFILQMETIVRIILLNEAL